MKSRIIILTTIILSSTFAFSQNCDCKKNFEWVKKTFEENDAGFAYAVEKKGKQAYEAHNLLISQKIKSTKKLSACTSLLYEWLTFFRSGHIAVTLNEQVQNQSSIKKNQVFTDWETHNLEIEDFKKLLDIKVCDRRKEGK